MLTNAKVEKWLEYYKKELTIIENVEELGFYTTCFEYSLMDYVKTFFDRLLPDDKKQCNTEQDKPSIEEYTAFVIALNHKIWKHHENDKRKAMIYNAIWTYFDIAVELYYKKEELELFFTQTD